MDHLIALHQCNFKLRRWPMKVFYHLMDLTLCNAWLLYILEHTRTHSDVKCLDLYQFKRNVTENHPKCKPGRAASQDPASD